MFYQTYLQDLENIRLIAIGLPAFYLDDVIRDMEPLDNYAGSGVYQLLKQCQSFPDGYVTRGYDILGSEHGGAFHSFFCNGLEQDYQDVLHLSLNAHGLIDYYESARQASEYTSLETTGAEPVSWYPWLIVEYPL